ncbi:hypothetical protein EGR_11128 [Echinococcus granulosus]|uniref:Uncharacterized protein n=1 Tax=Echinococcus granulosus TaxID=6210 RepID=W6TZ02_ECHGR|nr:hypothetical protein EGR_11128 [Echinococcus granulosus]EUB54015.1 hypothetical protein EGR_11128 [Echinococcus granulosus]
MKHLDSPDVGSTIPHKAAVSKMSATKDTSTTTTTTTTTSTTTTTTTTNTTNTNTTSSNVEAGHPMSESAVLESTCKATASVGCCAPDRLWFATLAPRPAARHAWLHELADIAAMQAQLQLALQNPRRFHFVCSVRRQAKTLASTDMTSLCTNWRSDEANAFLSAHSSTTQLEHGDGDENGNVDGNAGSAFTLECLHASHWRYVNF